MSLANRLAVLEGRVPDGGNLAQLILIASNGDQQARRNLRRAVERGEATSGLRAFARVVLAAPELDVKSLAAAADRLSEPEVDRLLACLEENG